MLSSHARTDRVTETNASEVDAVKKSLNSLTRLYAWPLGLIVVVTVGLMYLPAKTLPWLYGKLALYVLLGALVTWLGFLWGVQAFRIAHPR